MSQEQITEASVREALRDIRYPGMNRDIVSFGLVRAVSVRDGRVHVSLTLAATRAEVPDLLRVAIRERLAALGAVRSEVQIVPPERLGKGPQDPWADRGRLAGVKRIVAVGSGKGGVGKSTVAANLALALLRDGLRVGLLDADIFGPSIPTMLGLEDGAKRVRMTSDRKVIPLEAHGLAVVSFGFFLGPSSPAVWRGPIVSKAVKQFSRGVVWPDLDILVVDLPPGTGDVPLSLAQAVVVDGGVVVTTPQWLAVQEAEKAVGMFRKLDVPALGIVENMSYSLCVCGERSYPFGSGGGEALSQRTEVPLLASLPFETPVMQGGNVGLPLMVQNPTSVLAGVFAHLATQVQARLAATAGQVAIQHRTARTAVAG
jgi:ATP-binding protein involved in chromosome partitioning